MYLRTLLAHLDAFGDGQPLWRLDERPANASRSRALRDAKVPEVAASTPLPWIRNRSRLSIHARATKLRRIGDQANRAIGLLLILTRTGPARKDTRLYGLLHKLGVLDFDPRQAVNAPRLQRLPWGDDR